MTSYKVGIFRKNLRRKRYELSITINGRHMTLMGDNPIQITQQLHHWGLTHLQFEDLEETQAYLPPKPSGMPPPTSTL